MMELVDVVDSKSTVASPSAASGGRSEGVASAAVGEGRRRLRQGHSAGNRKRWRHQTAAGGHIKNRRQQSMTYRITSAGVMELVDVVDSKSTAGDSVPVRVRPPAPKKNATMIQFS